MSNASLAPSPPLLRIEDRGAVRVITLVHAARRNALSLAMIGALHGALEAAGADRSIRVVILAGEGPAFSAGHDLREIQAARTGADKGRAFFAQLMAACSAIMLEIRAMPQPVIAAVEGVATAAGCQLVASCDLAIAGAEARTMPLIPDIRGLTEVVKTDLSKLESIKDIYAILMQRFNGGPLANPTVEDILSHIRALQDVVRDGTIDGLTRSALSALDAAICDVTTKVVRVALPDSITPYHQLATWIGGIHRAHPIEVFTSNYDLLVEQALEAHKIPYFDGFVGSKQAFFDLTSMENESLPPRWARLWKVHGSVNWWRTPKDEVVRREGHSSDDRQMIYPSHLKYDQSRRMPYLAMLDRLRAFLARGQAVLRGAVEQQAVQHGLARGRRAQAQMRAGERRRALGRERAGPVDAHAGLANTRRAACRAAGFAPVRTRRGRERARQGFFAWSGLTFPTVPIGTACGGSAPQSSPPAGGGVSSCVAPAAAPPD